MIRKALFAIAAVATIAGAATTAQAGSYGHGGYSHGYTSYDVYKPHFRYIRKCHRVKVGHRKVWDHYAYGYRYKAIYKRRCRRVKVHY